MIPRFLDMISRQSAENYPTSKNEHAKDVTKKHRRRVYVTAIFEIKDGLELPNTKFELLQLLRQGKAITFHKKKNTKSLCHKIPRFWKWLKEDLWSGE